MNRTSFLWLLTLTLATSIGCFAESASPGGDDIGSPDEPGDPAADEGVGEPFARACARLHGECSSVCDNVLVECYQDVGTCTEQWTADYLADYDFPLIDPALVEQCAAQVERQPCTDLRPDTAACEYGVVESCPGDADAYGAPYSPFSAHRVQLGEHLDVHLCSGVEEFFVIALDAGAAIELVWPDEAPTAFADVLRVSTNAAGDAMVERSDPGAPVAQAGDYVLALEASDAGAYGVTIVPAA